MKNYIKSGEITTIPSAPYNAVAGAGMKAGKLFGICCTDATSGSAAEVRCLGEFDVLCVGTEAWAVGDVIYWDDAAKKFTTTSTSNSDVGRATLAKSSGAALTTGRVRLNGQIP